MTREALRRVEAGLPASWYRDPEHYRRELDTFWYARWIAAAREEEIARPGDWRAVRIGTQSIVLLRDESARLRAFHNTCRHRGSVLCTEESGSLARARLGAARPHGARAGIQAGRRDADPGRYRAPAGFPWTERSGKAHAVRRGHGAAEPVPQHPPGLRELAPHVPDRAAERAHRVHYVALWETTNRQDARNCEWQQQGLQSREFAHGVYVPQEFDVHRFAQWVRAGLEASGSGASR